jgi:type VI secretion system protein ImpA
MPPLDAAALADAISDDLPAGPNLEFDGDFGALERAAQGKPEQQYGTTVIPAEEPDWKEVAAQADALLQRTRDLRVLVHLAVARLHLNGLPAYVDLLVAAHTLLETRWDTVHPQLDPEDDNDPTLRANALLRFGHPTLVLKVLRTLPLAGTPRTGQFSWRDVAIATGEIEPDANGQKPAEHTIRAAFQDSDKTRLATLRDTAKAGAAAIAGITAVFDNNAGYGTGPDLADLGKLLTTLGRTIDRYVNFDAAEEAPVPQADPAPQQSAAAETPAPRQATGIVTAAALTDVSTRADALRLLDLVCRYYQRYEPSSPLPLLIERARRLADKGFLDVLRDLAPDGLMQAQSIVSSRDEE